MQAVGRWVNNSDGLDLDPADIIFNGDYAPLAALPPFAALPTPPSSSSQHDDVDDAVIDESPADDELRPFADYRRSGDDGDGSGAGAGSLFSTGGGGIVAYGGVYSPPPISACSLPCQPGTIRKQQGDTCCWICVPCADSEFAIDPFTCADCPAGHWPMHDRLSCYELPVEIITWSSSWYAGIPLAVAALGIVATLFVIALFVRANDTPLVRASGRELSYMLLSGIMMCYMNTFALLAPPTPLMCAVQRTTIGLAFSIVYGALLVKTNRISRIFRTSRMSAKRLKYISPRSQVSFAGGISGELFGCFGF